jgi:hypothetical protein
MNVDWMQAGYLDGTIIRQGPVLIALLVGLVACVVARARLGAKAAWLGFTGFAILAIGQLLSATFPLPLSLPGVRANQVMPIYSLLLVMIQPIGIGLLIGALPSRAGPRPWPQFPRAQFPPAQFPPAQFPPTPATSPRVLGRPPPPDKGSRILGAPAPPLRHTESHRPSHRQSHRQIGGAALSPSGTSSAELRHTWSMVRAVNGQSQWSEPGPRAMHSGSMAPVRFG